MAAIKDPNAVSSLHTLAPQQDIPSDGLYGISETSDAVVFLSAIASGAVRWKVTAPQTFLAWLGDEKVITKAVTAFTGYEKIPQELDDLSQHEIDMLVEVVTASVNFESLNLSPEERASGYTPPAKFGIGESTGLVRFLVRLGMFVAQNRVLNAGTIASGLFSLGPLLWDALSGIADVPKEFADLSSDEAQQLATLVATELDLADDSTELVVEQTWRCVLDLSRAVQALILALSSTVVDKAAAAKQFAGDIVRLAGDIAILTGHIKTLVSPPSSDPETV